MILTIAAISIAALISASLLSMTVSISSSVNRASDNMAEALLTEITIIHINKTSDSSTGLLVYVYNTGEMSMHQSVINVFYDGIYVIYNGSSSDHSWSISWPGQSSPNTILDPGELITIQINLPSSQTVGTGSKSVTISVGSFTDEYWFST